MQDLFDVPTCFRSVTNLNLSLLSPWGHALLCSSASDPSSLAQYLSDVFPSVTSLTLYARNPSILHFLAPQWPQFTHVKLVRWQQRPQLPPGAEFTLLFEHCESISSLDLSSFYCWTDDIPPALRSHPNLAARLMRLDLLNPSFTKGFKSEEIMEITTACPNLTQFLIACTFDHRYIGFVGDETLLSIFSHCPRLSVLHLVDTSALLNPRGDLNDEGFTAEDARIGAPALIDMFSGLPLIMKAESVCTVEK